MSLMRFVLLGITNTITMKIKLLFTGLCFCGVASFSYGQSTIQTLKEPVPVVVSSHPDLQAQRTKLDAKQTEINQAVTTSRAQVSKLNDELRVLKQEYVRLLTVYSEKTTDTETKNQLQQEMARYAETTNPQTR